MSLPTNEHLPALVSNARNLLKQHYGADATLVAAAPGRVNLIGEHIDYCDGFVLPFAIERYIVIAAAPNGTNQARLLSAQGDGEATIPLDEAQIISDLKWSNYLRGVFEGFRNRGNWPLPGFDACLVSNLPTGGGLSSSAALECATATLVEGLLGITLDIKEKALLCQKAEHDFANVPCGIMDQFASAFGQKDQLILIDCQSGEPQLIPFQDPSLTVLISNTMVSHELSDGGYESRRRDTEDGLKIIGKNSWRDVTTDDVENAKDAMGDRIYRRGRHVVGEIQRTIDAAAALQNNDYSTLGPLMAASHISLRDDFEVSCPELDCLVKIASEEIGTDGGVIGARMTGGGFGGSTVTLCHSDKAADIIATLEQRYQQETGITPQIFASRPAKGAHLA